MVSFLKSLQAVFEWIDASPVPQLIDERDLCVMLLISRHVTKDTVLWPHPISLDIQQTITQREELAEIQTSVARYQES